VVGDPVLVQELVELLVIDTVGAFHLPVQVQCPRADVGVGARYQVTENSDGSFPSVRVSVGTDFALAKE
jgi:hypothetical protein